MKRLYLLTALSLIFFTIDAQKRINICNTKTVHLFFPSTITYVDIGLPNYVLEEHSGKLLKLSSKEDSIFWTKAIRETNLTVITEDNYLFSYILNYNYNPKLNHFVTNMDGELLPYKVEIDGEIDQKDNSKLIDESIVKACIDISKRKQLIYDQGISSSKKIETILRNIHFYKDHVFFTISFDNNSNISYDVDFIEFVINPKKSIKKSSQQIELLEPYYTHNDIDVIDKNTKDHIFVFVFEKFTIPDEKRLLVKFYERKGSRNFSFYIDNKYLLNAPLLNL